MSEIAGRVLMIPKGTYSPTTTYDPLDAVNYEHNSYVCKQTSRGNLPTNTTYWQPLTDVTADEIPTEGSTNLVQSGGVYSANQTLTNKLNNEAATRSAMGAKNLIPFDLASIKAKNSSDYPSGSWNNNEWTINGVTFAIQDDNTVVATGSNTSNSNAQLDYYITIKGGVPYIANGCPSGGSYTTYEIANYCLTSPAETFHDLGNGVAITRTANTTIIVHMQVKAGYTIDGQLVFKPMIRLATDSNSDHQPYAMTNKELTDKKVDIAGIPRQELHRFAPNSTTTTITVPLDKVSNYAQGSLHIRTSSKDSEAHITFALSQGNISVVTSTIKNYGTVDLSLDSMTISGQELSIVIGGGKAYQWYSAEYFASLSEGVTAEQPTWNFA